MYFRSSVSTHQFDTRLHQCLFNFVVWTKTLVYTALRRWYEIHDDISSNLSVTFFCDLNLGNTNIHITLKELHHFREWLVLCLPLLILQMSTLIILDQCAINVGNFWHFVLRKKIIPFVVTMEKLPIKMLFIPLFMQCSMTFIRAQHLNLESFLNPFKV